MKELVGRLRERRDEIEAAILARVYSVADPVEAPDSDYAQGLRSAVSRAIDYGLAAIEAGEAKAPPVPPELLAQARLSARNGVSLDTVLRRYVAGYTLLGDFLIEEAQESDLFDGESLQRMMAGLSALLDRLVAVVSDEHSRAAPGTSGSPEERRASHVKRLLAGEFLDASGLAYDFEGHHLGLVAEGPRAKAAICELAGSLDKRLLSIAVEEKTQWAWLGSGKATDPDELRDFASKGLSADTSLAIGEPARGMEGWRLTHRQARAALPIALRDPEREVVRYADVALLASILQDELLVRSLRQLYLEPLATERDGGEVLRATLRAYFEAERNVSSAAAVLGVKRHTVTKRLRMAEERLGRSLTSCAAEIGVALSLEDIGYSILPHRSMGRK
jgi:hypothetical protein